MSTPIHSWNKDEKNTKAKVICIICCRTNVHFLHVSKESRNSHTHFHNENLLFSMLDLFAAGTETISTPVRWGLLMMMKYPEIQSKTKN